MAKRKPLTISTEPLTVGEYMEGVGIADFLKYAALYGRHLGQPAVKPKMIKRKGEKPFLGLHVDEWHLIPLLKPEINVLIEEYLMNKRKELRQHLKSKRRRH